MTNRPTRRERRMRRKEQEISDPEELAAVLQEALVCRLAMTDDKAPYIVPLSFGYRDKALYFHSAAEGRKVALLRQHPEVCFEVEAGIEMTPGRTPCNWGVAYRSIIGYGRATFLTDPDEKRKALDIIVAHYTDGDSFDYPEAMLSKTAAIRVDISAMTGKRSA